MVINTFVEITKLTLIVHHGLYSAALEVLKQLGIKSIMVESSRTARLRDKNTLLGLLGLAEPIEDSPSDIIRFIVEPNSAEKVISVVISKLDLKTPGRGCVFAQDLLELNSKDFPKIEFNNYASKGTILNDLTLITGIQSFSGSGENISKVALKLSAGVPVVSLGKGTGIRDRLGLLRITISPEKELTYLLVPSFDANGLQNLLIEKGKLNRPGGGFMYQTPIRFGLVDSLLRVGNNEHAASLEQIVAAIDDIKQSTSWRKRIFDETDSGILPTKTHYTHREICFICPVDHSDDYVQAAMDVGAAGATMTNMRCINLSDDNEEIINYENAIMCVKKEDEEKIVNAIIKLAEAKGEKDWFVQKIPASSIYATYRKK